MFKKILLIVAFLSMLVTGKLLSQEVASRPLSYYANNYETIVKNAEKTQDKTPLYSAIVDLEKIKSKCTGGCDQYAVYYLLGVFKCALNDQSGRNEYSICLTARYHLSGRNYNYIKSRMETCPNDDDSNPFVIYPGERKEGNLPGSGGNIKNNQLSSRQFKKEYSNIYDTSLRSPAWGNIYSGSFTKNEKEQAIKYYKNLIDSSGLKNVLTSYTATENFIVFHHDANNEIKTILNELENNLAFFKSHFNLNSSEQLISLFIIPDSKLSDESKREYGWKFAPHFAFPYHHSRRGMQRQESDHGFEFSLGNRIDAPLYLYKKQFLQFVYFKDGVKLEEGEVGFCNYYNSSLTTFEKNGIGAINHELIHLLISYNFPGCPLWLNEGIACLFEAASYNKKTQELKPQNNFRLTDAKDINLTAGNALDSILVNDWDSLAGMSIQQKMATARYLCFYLFENNKLEAFFKNVVNNASFGTEANYQNVMNELITITGDANLDELNMGYKQFLDNQGKIALKENGQLKKQYKKGLYQKGKFY